MKALLYATAALVTVVIGMNIASGMANNAKEELVEKNLNKYEQIEQQLQGN